MEWQRQLDNYCERTSPAFWAEPVNALTNLAFILAALVALVALYREDRRDAAAIWLILLVVSIGIGSFLFHTVATVWAALTDVLPITLFIVSFLALAVRRFFAAPWWIALLVAAAFLPAAEAASAGIGDLVGDGLNGSESYLPALTALVVTGALLARRGHPAGPPLLGGAGLFALSLVFRTVDAPLCAALPLGTHFVWHVLNGVLLGWLVLTMIRYGKPALKPA